MSLNSLLNPTLSSYDFRHMLRAGHRNTLRHVLGLLGTHLLETDAGQRIDEGPQVPGTLRLRHGGQGLVEAEHGEFEGQLKGPLVAQTAWTLHVENARCRHLSLIVFVWDQTRMQNSARLV